MFKKIRKILEITNRTLQSTNKTNDILVHQTIENLRSSSRYDDERNLIRYGHKVYSQNDEDGIINEIFNRIGTTNKVFVEFGIGNGLENNTLALLFDDWQGLWIDGNIDSVNAINQNFKNTIESGRLAVINSFITRENINNLISSKIKEKEIDLMSIDIDGNDYHVLEAINCVKARVLVIEYNAKFPPHISYCMNYNKDHTWKNDDNFGASLKFLEIALKEKGYHLVGCNLLGANAFFVRSDLINNKFQTPFTAEMHYEPARYYLAAYSSGHKAAYATLENSSPPRNN